MKKERVLLTLTGTHARTGGSSEEVVTKAEGTCISEDGNYTIEYTENDPETKAMTQAIVSLSRRRMKIIRSGQTTSLLLFEVGTPHRTSYQTPFGAFWVELQTETYFFHASPDERQIQAEAEYTLHMNGAEVSHVTMKMDIQKI